MIDALQANTYTAEPLLKLLIAMEGCEPSTPDAIIGWRVWRQFLAIPAAGEDDASFQVAIVDGPDARICQVHLTRQLTDSVSGIAGYTVQVVMQFDYQLDPKDEGDPLELWQSDFKEPEVFFTTIERSRGYRLMMQETPVITMVYQQELDPFEADIERPAPE